MFKKIISLILVLALAVGCGVSLASCGGQEFKIGFICLHDDKSTYDLNFINAAKAAQEALGLKDSQVIIVTMINEDEACYRAAADLVDQGCSIIFANSFGHEPFMIQAAKEFPNVEFCHATGVKAHTEKLSNYHNAFASIYEGRYLAGVAAGLKHNQLKEEGKLKGSVPKIGYVGAHPYAEVKSGYTSFYLGAKSVCPDVVMDVTFTGEWFEPTLEKNAAQALIAGGCDLISQHADSMGAPSACENAGVPNISYNGSTQATCPNTFIVSSRIDWQPYFEYIINCAMNDKAIDTDWTGTIATGSVKLTEINDKAAAPGTAEKIAEVEAKLKDGTLKVFDTSTFTVDGGKTLTSYLADVDDFGDFKGETEVVKDGYFAESFFRSAPYFDINIDGITILD